jgi:protein TonB
MNELRAQRVKVLPFVLVLAAIAGLTGCGGDPPAEPQTQAGSPAGAPPVAAQPAAVAAPATDAAPQTVPELLDAARSAMREQRLIQPVGNNAIEYYLKVLDAEPNNRQAQLAILELMPLAQGVAEKMIDDDRLDEAQEAVGLLKRAQPTSVVVTNLEQRIVLQRRAEEQRLKSEEEAARLAERQARDQAAAEAQAAAQPAPAPAPAEPTRTATAPPPEPTAPAPAQQPPTQVASAAPAQPVAAATAPQNKDFALVKRVNPSYPPQALRSRTEGWVELSFTITANGDVEDVSVVDAEPRRVFDREASRALGQWKFTPRVEGGKPVAAKARQRLAFTLN